MQRSLPALLALLVLASPLPAQESARDRAFERARAALAQRQVPQIESLARWARGARLYREEALLFQGLITLDADHARARKALRYHRVSGEWRQARSWRMPRNHGHSELEAYREHFERAVGPYRDGVLRLCSLPDLSPSDAHREAVLRDLLAFHPDDPVLRGALDEVFYDERWVLRETRSALEHRVAIADRARAALAAVPELTEERADRAERGARVSLPSGRATRHIRVLGTVRSPEVADVARTGHAVRDLFEAVFSRPGRHRSGYSVYLLARPEHLAKVLPLCQDPAVATTLQSGPAGGWLSPIAWRSGPPTPSAARTAPPVKRWAPC